MNSQEKKVVERVGLALESLDTAAISIDSIKRDDRTEDVDKLLNEAADHIYEAQCALKKVGLEQYDSGYVGEHIVLKMRHRKNKKQ